MADDLRRLQQSHDALARQQDAEMSKIEAQNLRSRLDELQDALDALEEIVEYVEAARAGSVPVPEVDLFVASLDAPDDPSGMLAGNDGVTLIKTITAQKRRARIALIDGYETLVDEVTAQPLDESLESILVRLDLSAAGRQEAVEELRAASDHWHQLVERARFKRNDLDPDFTSAPKQGEVFAATDRLDQAWEGLSVFGLGDERVAMLREASGGTLGLADVSTADLEWFREVGLAPSMHLSIG